MLENKLGITDSTELARMEERISKQKALEMFESGFFETLEPGTYKSLAMIHQCPVSYTHLDRRLKENGRTV